MRKEGGAPTLRERVFSSRISAAALRGIIDLVRSLRTAQAAAHVAKGTEPCGTRVLLHRHRP